MTTAEYNADLEKKLEQIRKGVPFGLAFASHLAMMSERIFSDGENGNGGKIGQYNSTNPLYVNPKTQSPKSFPLRGKDNTKGFKTVSIKTRKKTGKSFKYTSSGKQRKTGWFPSYKAFKQAIGQESSFVTLDLTGMLKKDFSNSLKRINALFWRAELKNPKNDGKYEGAVDKYGKIVFESSKKEDDALVASIQRETDKLFGNA